MQGRGDAGAEKLLNDALAIQEAGAFCIVLEMVPAELAAEDAYFKEVWDDLQEFRAGYKVWNDNIYLPRPRN